MALAPAANGRIGVDSVAIGVTRFVVVCICGSVSDGHSKMRDSLCAVLSTRYLFVERLRHEISSAVRRAAPAVSLRPALRELHDAIAGD